MDEAIVREYQTPYAGILRSISGVPGAEFVDLNDLFCDESVCSMRKGTTLMYRDNNHLNIPGSRLVGSELLKRSTYLRLP
jgi:lysophospholipase L1-like esterase